MINQVMLVGRLTENPRVRGSAVELALDVERAPRDYSPGGKCSVQVRAAVSERRRDVLMQYLSKGNDVMVHGYLTAFEHGLGVLGDRVDFVGFDLVSHSLMDTRPMPPGLLRRSTTAVA